MRTYDPLIKSQLLTKLLRNGAFPIWGPSTREGDWCLKGYPFPHFSDAQNTWDWAQDAIFPAMSYKRVGDLREQLIKGEKINNKGSYLATLIQLEAKNRDLPWALKD